SSADPSSTSARAMLSDHKASPVVTGRFRSAGAHAESPAARKDRLPEMSANRPTRAGGSLTGSGATSGVGACTTCVTQDVLVAAMRTPTRERRTAVVMVSMDVVPKRD